ncbi:hypothetical protein M8J76_009716 [Diaphorina citri]|nr:hypothetical protein M8J76_009716 [Diaphorina citri]
MSCCPWPCRTPCCRCYREPCCCTQHTEPDSGFNVSLCNILALLALWMLFDLFCCYLLSDEFCWIASSVLLSALAGLGVIYLYQTALRLLRKR